MDKIIKHFRKDRYAALTGIELLEASNGYAKAKLKISEKHLNSVGTVHGGAIFTLADFVFAVASNSYGNIAVAINANIYFHKAITGGTLIAEAKEISFHRKLASYNVKITDEENELVADFNGMVYRKEDSIKFE
jgi:acyl-CoA thioesterase